MKTFLDWLSKRPRWLQRAAVHLTGSRQLTESQLADLLELCLREASGGKDLPRVELKDVLPSDVSRQEVLLTSIDEVSGFDALAPRSPLDLGSQRLTVIYGENGSGKSGYVRILKAACGARRVEALREDVFGSTPQKQSCRIHYAVDGAPITSNWTPAVGVVDQLRGVSFFDSRLGRIVLTEENEVTYEPEVLTFLSDMVSVCDTLRGHLDAKIQATPSQLPKLPPEYLATGGGAWYQSLTSSTSAKQVREACMWTDGDALKLRELTTRLAASSPEKAATALRRRIKNIQDLQQAVTTWEKALADAKCTDVKKTQQELVKKRRVADLAATTAFSSAPLGGVGTEPWSALWEHARAYSESEAYPDASFPVVDEDSRCVLCQQALGAPARNRLSSFEEFVTGEANREVRAVKTTLEKSVSELGTPPATEIIEQRLDAAGFDDESVRKHTRGFFGAVRKRHQHTVDPNSTGKIPPLREMTAWTSSSVAVVDSLTLQAKGFDDDAKSGDSSGTGKQRDELAVRHWISAQEDAVKAEIDRLGKHEMFAEAKRLTSTTGLSKKKGELAAQLVSEAFIKGFRTELNRLGAERISVELIRTRTDRGHTLHQVQIQGHPNAPVGEILSEGEFRVVALAATLADAAIGGTSSPFVFDDPISSLDQRFEEALIQRLVDLAQERQVIVFTHRLSLLGLVEEYARKASIETNIVCVRREPWGTGEPGRTPLAAKKPANALKNLRDEHLPRASKALEKDGTEGYYPLAKAICSDVRILLERTIEFILLADVVQRHRRAINTVNKLDKVAKVEAADCGLFDRLMTKYSRFEHSHSLEAPVRLPDPAELQADLDEVISWIAEFGKR